MMLARSPRLMLRGKLCCWLELSRFDGEKLGWLFGLLEPASHDAPVVPHACLSLSVRQATTMVVRGLGCAALCLPVSVCTAFCMAPKARRFPIADFADTRLYFMRGGGLGVCVCEEFSRETRFHTPKAEHGAVQLCFKSCCCC